MSKTKAKGTKLLTASRTVTVITLLSSVALFMAVLYLGFLPEKYVMMIGAGLVVFNLLFGFIGWSKRVGTINKVLQMMVCVILSIAMIAGSVAIPYYKNRLADMFVSLHDVSELRISVFVRSESELENVRNLEDAKVGIHALLDRDHLNEAISDINKLIADDVNVNEFDNIFSSIDALYNGNIDALLLNEAYVSLIVDNDDYSDFISKTKVIYTVTQEVANSHTQGFNGVVTKAPFVVLVGGGDNFVDLSQENGNPHGGGRTDVNMVVVVNPVTSQILMVTIPRDTYVSLMGDPNMKDKLTHSSAVSIDVWEDCVESIFGGDLNVDFFVRVNFSSLVKIVDAMGGITFNNPYAFSSIYHDVYENGELVRRKYYYPKGEVTLNGNQTLLYVRERYNLPNGDFSRNEHQALVMRALIKKATSSEIISKANDLLEAMNGSFLTDMSFNQISSLIRKQVNDNIDWKISSYSLKGYSKWAYSYLMGYGSSMVFLNADSVETAKGMIQKVLAGEVLE